MSGGNPYRDEILTLLRTADCHYGNTLRDEEAGWTAERAARARNVQLDRIVELRHAVHAVVDGEFSQNMAQAGHEGGVFRALLHFRGDMSEGLRQYIDTQITRLRSAFDPALKATPLQCTNRGANQPKAASSRERACECGLTHAGACW
jgi:hypothetical protein